MIQQNYLYHAYYSGQIKSQLTTEMYVIQNVSDSDWNTILKTKEKVKTIFDCAHFCQKLGCTAWDYSEDTQICETGMVKLRHCN